MTGWRFPSGIPWLDQKVDHLQPIARVLNPQTFGRRVGLRPVVFSLREKRLVKDVVLLERGELTRRLRGDLRRRRDRAAIVRVGVHARKFTRDREAQHGRVLSWARFSLQVTECARERKIFGDIRRREERVHTRAASGAYTSQPETRLDSLRPEPRWIRQGPCRQPTS